jgi:tetraacyldisaccharide 4'-kinase
MDDGMQNPGIFKDLQIIMLDGLRRIGNGFMLPAGPLRQKLNNIKKNNIVVCLKNTKAGSENDVAFNKISTQIINTRNKITNKTEKIKNNKFIAFCGIGNNERFKNLLEQNNIQLVKFYSFENHYNYNFSDIQKLVTHAIKNRCKLITTKKDFIKIKEIKNIDQLKIKTHIITIEVEIEFDKIKDQEFIQEKIKTLLQK